MSHILKDNIDKLIEVLKFHARNDDERASVDLYRKVVASTESQETVENMMAYALVDGLKYGNWPWVHVNTRQSK